MHPTNTNTGAQAFRKFSTGCNFDIFKVLCWLGVLVCYYVYYRHILIKSEATTGTFARHLPALVPCLFTAWVSKVSEGDSAGGFRPFERVAGWCKSKDLAYRIREPGGSTLRRGREVLGSRPRSSGGRNWCFLRSALLPLFVVRFVLAF